MGSHKNFKIFGTEPPPASSNRPPGNVSLARQSSVYSLTFDEFQNTVGGIGKDFGSMNMDELLKSIWSAEENQTMASTGGNGGQDGANGQGGYLQRQGSLTLPRTLSQKTVDEVWRDISKEYIIGKDGIVATGGTSMAQAQAQAQVQAQKQQALGEVTLEEFLVRAGFVREDIQLPGKPNAGGIFSELSRAGNNNGLGAGFQQTGRSPNLMGMRNLESVTPLPIQTASNLPLNINGVRSNQQLNQPPQQGHQQHILPKQSAVSFASQVPSTGGAQLGSPGMRGGLMGIADQVMTNNLVQASAFQGGGIGMVGLGGAPIVATGSPANPASSDGMARSNGDTSSVSPVPYIFNGGMRGRKGSSALEKVVERRQRRMIKNRESAARSRARKQAYTMELEAEVAKLKEENEDLRKKQVEIMEMQKNQVIENASSLNVFQVVEMMNMQGGVKRRCLRRTQTGPW